MSVVAADTSLGWAEGSCRVWFSIQNPSTIIIPHIRPDVKDNFGNIYLFAKCSSKVDNEILIWYNGVKMDIWTRNKYYKTICADPPWQLRISKGRPEWGDPTYPTMSFKEIATLPVNAIAHEDCALLLWVTMPMLNEGLKVIESWGFTYKTCAFVWVKLNPNCNIIYIDGDIILDGGIYSGLGRWVNEM